MATTVFSVALALFSLDMKSWGQVRAVFEVWDPVLGGCPQALA